MSTIKSFSAIQNLVDKYFRLIGRLIPEEKQEFALSLTITDSAVCAIQLLEEAGQYYIVNWGYEHIDQRDTKEAIGRLLQRMEIAPPGIFTSVFGRGTLIRYIDLPRMSRKELHQAVLFESDKYFPFPSDTVYIDCFPLDSKGKSAKMPVLVAAVKRDSVDERVEMLAEIGLQVDLVGVNSVATANAFHVLELSHHESKDQSAIAIIDIGESISNLTVMKNGLPYFSRDIFVGAQEMTKRVANLLGVDKDEAELFLAHPGDKKDQINQVCESVVQNLVGEIRMSMDYFITERNIPIDIAYLIGFGSKIDGLDKIIKESFNLETLVWDPLMRIKVAESAPQGIELCIHKLISAVGLSLYQYDKN